MVASYVAGESSEQIAGRYGVAANSVLRLLHERGVEVRVGKLSLADVEQIIELYGQGMTQRAIGPLFGVTRCAVRAVLVKRGVTLRERAPRC